MSKLPSKTRLFTSLHLADGIYISAERRYSPSKTDWWWTITIQGPNHRASIDMDRDELVQFAEALLQIAGGEDEE